MIVRVELRRPVSELVQVSYPAIQNIREQGTQYESQNLSENILIPQDSSGTQNDPTDPWNEYKAVFNLDRRYVKYARAAIVDVIIKISVIDKEARVDRCKLIDAVTKDQLRDRNYKKQVSSLVSELLCEGISEDNIIRGLRLKDD